MNTLAIHQFITQIQEQINRGDLPGAEAALRSHLASGTGPIPLWRLLVRAIRPQGKIGETRVIQEMLVNHSPADLATRFDLSETLLLLGEFERGWQEYRYRYSLQHTKVIERKVQMPRWGGNPIPGQTLFIHDEQGFGDTFQFVRLLRLAKERSQARIIFEINSESASLIMRSFADVVDQFVVKGNLPPPFDQHCELMSLPHAFRLQFNDLPGPLPYLKPDPDRAAKWATRLKDLPRPWIALCWAGRPTHFNDINRSTHLKAYTSLFNIGASFISIQKGPATEQAKNFPRDWSFLNLDAEIQDFEDTAAILSLVDILVSVDSSPVHLAGAIGCPAWVLLPFVPDWRWLINRSDTPWYPQHRLYRQPQIGNWDAVIQAIHNDLLSLVRSSKITHYEKSSVESFTHPNSDN